MRANPSLGWFSIQTSYFYKLIITFFNLKIYNQIIFDFYIIINQEHGRSFMVSLSSSSSPLEGPGSPRIKIQKRSLKEGKVFQTPSDRKLSKVVRELRQSPSSEALVHPKTREYYTKEDYESQIQRRKKRISDKEKNRSDSKNKLIHGLERVKNVFAAKGKLKTDAQLLNQAKHRLQSMNPVDALAKSKKLSDSSNDSVDTTPVVPRKVKRPVRKLVPESNVADSEKKLNHLREKNLTLSQESLHKPKLKVTHQQFDSESKDVHGGRVFRRKKVMKGEGVQKKGESHYYVKTEPNVLFEYVCAPIFSLFVPGSPDVVRFITEKGPFQFATKEVPGGRLIEASDLKRGYISGLARSAVIALLGDYKDRRTGNALLDKHRRIVLIDYEFGGANEKMLQKYAENPINYLRPFIWDCKESELKVIGESEEFKKEFAQVVLQLATFPIELLLPIIANRFDPPSLSLAESFVERFQESLELFTQFFPVDYNAFPDMTKDEIAEAMIQQMAESRVLRELPYEELKTGIMRNLSKESFPEKTIDE